MRYFWKKLALKLIWTVPQPSWFYRACRFYCELASAENFGDITLNGEALVLHQCTAGQQILALAPGISV